MPKPYAPLRKSEGGFLPKTFDVAHDLCFVLHDAMAAILVEGEAGGVFRHNIGFPNVEATIAFGQADNPVEWLAANGMEDDAAKVLKCITFPAVLSDMLSCLYEALECSRKAKLNVTFMLLRKPLQESLYLFEEMVLGLDDFARKLSKEPLTLRAGRAGGLDAHAQRIARVVKLIGAEGVYEPRRIAELRFDKVEGFDGPCNQAMHLFTEHQAIRTELMNINFVFSGTAQKVSQWDWLYLNLPILMDYMRNVVEYLAHDMALLDPRYQEELTRKIAALVWLWADGAEPEGVDPALARYATCYRDWLQHHCEEAGHPSIDTFELHLMAHGSFPGEAPVTRRVRAWRKPKPWKRRKL